MLANLTNALEQNSNLKRSATFESWAKSKKNLDKLDLLSLDDLLFLVLGEWVDLANELLLVLLGGLHVLSLVDFLQIAHI